jgi:hypothetical protein
VHKEVRLGAAWCVSVRLREDHPGTPQVLSLPSQKMRVNIA